jgi:glycosyltransferase involved in cell wall biosynthesis
LIHRPLRVQFVLTSLPVGGAETLLLNLIRKMDRVNFLPEVVCLKEPGELGPTIAELAPVHSRMIANKWDVRVLWRLARLFSRRQADAVITVGAGDKMFWGRLAAKLAGVPVICSALHSTGWPDGVGRLNRLLTWINDGFIAVASDHARFMVECEKFPGERVFMIPNGVNTSRFVPDSSRQIWLRSELGIAKQSKIVGIVAALRSEKNHLQFVEAAELVVKHHENTHFVIVGDGPERSNIAAAIDQRNLRKNFHLLGSRSDTEKIVAGLDLFCLTSRNEANPVSILEALSCGVPVVAPKVGSIHETVIDGITGYLTEPLSAESTSDRLSQLLSDNELAKRLGLKGRSLVVDRWSLSAMIQGYQDLVEQLYNRAADRTGRPRWTRQLADPVNLPSETAVAVQAASLPPIQTTTLSTSTSFTA